MDLYLNLVANEASMSQTARRFLSSRFSERYFCGRGDSDRVVDFGVFTGIGYPALQSLIDSAEASTGSILGAEVVNLSTLSGIHAMICVLTAASAPGDRIMSLNPSSGGHFATATIVKSLGRECIFAPCDPHTFQLEPQEIGKIVRAAQVKLVYLDVMYSVSSFQITELRRALPPETLVVFDASHFLGLMMGRALPSPLREGADIVCANTHKTLPGPHKGLIAYRDRNVAEKLEPQIKSFYSSSHPHHTAALAVTLLEMGSFGEDYARMIIQNANALGSEFANRGFDVRKSGEVFTETHQLHVFSGIDSDYRNFYRQLLKNGILTTFTNGLSGPVFMRIGTQDITRRGLNVDDMPELAEIMCQAMRGRNVVNRVNTMLKRCNRILYSFDT